MNVEKKLSDHIHSFIELKRLWQVIEETLKMCAEKEISNDLLYSQLLFSSLDGLIVRFCNFTVETHKILDQIRSNKPKDFSYIRVQGHVKKIIPTSDSWLRDHSAKSLEKTYLRWFSSVLESTRAEKFPFKVDFDRIKKKIDKVFKPIKSHRDTVVAHNDKKPKPASVKDLDSAFEFYENLLGDLYFLHSFGSYSFNMGGLAADPKRSAEELANIILLNSYLREQEILQRHGVLK